MKLFTLALTALCVNTAASTRLIGIDSSPTEKKYRQEKFAHEQVSFISASSQQHQKSIIPKNNDETNISFDRNLAKGKKSAATGGEGKKGKKGTGVGSLSGKKEKGKKSKGGRNGTNNVEGNLPTSAPNTPDAKSKKVAYSNLFGGTENSTSDNYTPTPSIAPVVQPTTLSPTISPSNTMSLRTRSPTIMLGPDDVTHSNGGDNITPNPTSISPNEDDNAPTTEIDSGLTGTSADESSTLVPVPAPTFHAPTVPDDLSDSDEGDNITPNPTPISSNEDGDEPTTEIDGDYFFTGTGADEPSYPIGNQSTTEIDVDSSGTGADEAFSSVPSLAPTPGPDEDTSAPISEPTPTSTTEIDGDFAGTGADEPFNPPPAPTPRSKLYSPDKWNDDPGPTPVQEPNVGPSPITLNDLLDNDEAIDGSGRGDEDRDRDRDEGFDENSERENGNENPYFLCFGANTTGSMVVPVNFQYILTVSTSDENAVNSLLKYVEGQLLEAVENAGLCARRLEKSNDPLQGHRRLSGVVEVSSLPQDRPNYEINCGTNCIVVNGGMTLEIEGGMDETDAECQIIDIVRASMRDLVGASFLESEAICVSANGAEEDENPGGGSSLRGDSSGSFPIGITTTIAIGAAALVVVAYAFATRRGGEDDDDYETIFSTRAPGTLPFRSKDDEAMSPPMTSCDIGTQSPVSGYVYSVEPALSPESLLTPQSCETRSSVSSSPDEQLLCHELCDESPKVDVESVEKEEHSIDEGDVHHRSFITNTSFSINDSITTFSQASGSPRNLGIRPSPEEAEWSGDSELPESLFKSDAGFNPDSSFAPDEEDNFDLLPDGMSPGESEDRVEPISKLRSIPTMTPIKENTSTENDQSTISVPCDELDVTHDSFEELRGSYLPQKYDHTLKAKEESGSASSP